MCRAVISCVHWAEVISRSSDGFYLKFTFKRSCTPARHLDSPSVPVFFKYLLALKATHVL